MTMPEAVLLSQLALLFVGVAAWGLHGVYALEQEDHQ